MASYGGVVHVVCLLPLSNNLLWTHTHTHTQPFNGPFSRTTRVSQYQKGKTNLDFTEARDGEWQWNQLGHMQVCTLLQTDNHTSTPSLCFLQAGCPFCRPTKSVKALKALLWTHDQEMSMIDMPQCYTKLSEGLLWLGSYFLCLVKESTAHVLVSFFHFCYRLDCMCLSVMNCTGCALCNWTFFAGFCNMSNINHMHSHTVVVFLMEKELLPLYPHRQVNDCFLVEPVLTSCPLIYFHSSVPKGSLSW